ncbi:hypothetical protein CHARACLAT_012504 [Characodon lateralis]|uniref:Uncharacterized protein n=1 Tax=Characodon lateralis TaxID=208331 RepID=A0ABU7CMM3_9TELE|nr:hypothetical protein [Characodon lateralis]
MSIISVFKKNERKSRFCQLCLCPFKRLCVQSVVTLLHPIESVTRSERDGDVEKMEEISNIEAAVELVEGGEEQLIPKENGFSKDDVEQKTAVIRFGSGSGARVCGGGSGW